VTAASAGFRTLEAISASGELRMSRALSLATVTLLIGCFSAMPAQAQNLEAGKSPSQIFVGTCNACHKSPRGLLKTVPAGSLPSFLRQHYTTSGEMASLLSAFLISNGATDTRYVGTQPKPGRDAKSEGKPSSPPEQLDRFGRRLRPAPEASRPDAEPQQAAKPDAEGRNAKRLAQPGEAADGAKPGTDERGGGDGRKSATKQKLSKRGKPGSEEPPKTDAAKEEPAKSEAVKDDKPSSETAKEEGSQPDGSAKPSGEGKSEAAGVETPKDTGSGEPPTLRADPVPPVTPAPPAAPAVSAAASSESPEPAAEPPAPAVALAAPEAQPVPPAVAASVPPPPPIAPAGPPAPPISQ
jgi:hypothetical protein